METENKNENSHSNHPLKDQNDIVTLPEWLTKQFIEDILRWHFRDNSIEIIQLQVDNLTTKGISFSSVLHRLIILLKRNGEQEQFQTIIKAHPTGETGVTARKNKLFPREILVYKEILPQIHEFLLFISSNYTNDDNNNNENLYNYQISPICYYTTENPEPLLLLEDMKLSNYVMYKNGYLLNLEHVLIVIHKLSKLHATTAKIYEQNSNLMNFFYEGPISSNPDRQDFLGFFPANIKSLALEVQKWNGYENIAKKLFNLEKTILQKAIKMFESNQEYENNSKKKFKVLNLGDLWINNLMFRYNENDEPEDVIMFDYQLSYFGSPAIDLNYFLYGSLNENVRKVHYKFIIQEYHRILKDTLEKLNYKGEIPTLKDIHIEMIEKSLHGVIAATCLTPIILMDIDKYDNFDGLFQACKKGDKFRSDNIQNPKYKTFIQKTLKEFDISGFLD